MLDLPSGGVQRRRRPRRGPQDGDDRHGVAADEFHDRVRERFLDLARREPHRYLVLDAAAGVEEVAAEVRARVRDLLPISPRRRAALPSRPGRRGAGPAPARAAAEAEVLRLDAELRARQLAEAQQRAASRQRAEQDAEQDAAAPPTELLSAVPDETRQLPATPPAPDRSAAEKAAGKAADAGPPPGPPPGPLPGPLPGPPPGPPPGKERP